MWCNSAVTYMLTCLKNNVVATGASKKLVATVLGWNQSLIAAMFLHNNNNNNDNNNNNNNNNSYSKDRLNSIQAACSQA